MVSTLRQGRQAMRPDFSTWIACGARQNLRCAVDVSALVLLSTCYCLAELPDNPCDVLTRDQVASVADVEVSAVRRPPGIQEIVRARNTGRQPEPGRTCLYETRSEFGAILIVVPALADRTTARYYEGRDRYFSAFPGSASAVAGLGEDAWISGGTRLQVLVGTDEYFSVGTQLYSQQTRDLLIALARAVLDHL
jgi:hypothetical protein